MMYVVLLLCMTLMGSVASLFLKRASDSDGFAKLLLNINLYIGGMLYLISAILNIYLLRVLDYSVVLPLTSITYIWTLVLARLVLKERITIRKFFGVVFIVFGAVMLSLA